MYLKTLKTISVYTIYTIYKVLYDILYNKDLSFLKFFQGLTFFVFLIFWIVDYAQKSKMGFQ